VGAGGWARGGSDARRKRGGDTLRQPGYTPVPAGGSGLQPRVRPVQCAQPKALGPLRRLTRGAAHVLGLDRARGALAAARVAPRALAAARVAPRALAAARVAAGAGPRRGSQRVCNGGGDHQPDCAEESAQGGATGASARVRNTRQGHAPSAHGYLALERADSHLQLQASHVLPGCACRCCKAR
jgi:hypothetical protein